MPVLPLLSLISRNSRRVAGKYCYFPKAGLIRILFSVCVGEFRGWSLIPPGPSIWMLLGGIGCQDLCVPWLRQ